MAGQECLAGLMLGERMAKSKVVGKKFGESVDRFNHKAYNCFLLW